MRAARFFKVSDRPFLASPLHAVVASPSKPLAWIDPTPPRRSLDLKRFLQAPLATTGCGMPNPMIPAV